VRRGRRRRRRKRKRNPSDEKKEEGERKGRRGGGWRWRWWLWREVDRVGSGDIQLRFIKLLHFMELPGKSMIRIRNKKRRRRRRKEGKEKEGEGREEGGTLVRMLLRERRSRRPRIAISHTTIEDDEYIKRRW